MRTEAVALGIGLALLGFFSLSAMTGLVVYDLIPATDAPPILSTAGYEEVQVIPQPLSLQLEGSCRRLEMAITADQSMSVQKGMESERDFRPHTHDLIQDILETFEMKVLMVKIEKVEADTYFARLVIEQDNRILNLDAKPSDAVAVAVRERAPVYVKSELLASRGRWVC